MTIARDTLDLRAIHDQIHNLVLSRRYGVALWENAFETAWAGTILARHRPENRQEEIINSIKGAILGENRIATISTPSDLAACYMIAAFLHSIGVTDDAIEYIKLAESFVQNNIFEIDQNERFHFYSTPEYVYAASLLLEQLPDYISYTSVSALQQAATVFYNQQWFNRSYVYALAGSSYLRLNMFQESDCTVLANYTIHYQPTTLEDTVAILWFLEMNWERMRERVHDQDLVKAVDSYLIKTRTEVFRFFPNFITEPFDLEQTRLETTTQQLERVASDRVVSTIELLMLDEVAERHSVSALVVTKEEWARRETLSTLFERYKLGVDAALEKLGLQENLQAIYQNLDSSNPAHWSQAALSCRQVLYELADVLLQIPDTTYPFIKSGDGKPMSLAKDKEKNRLQAYMHQVGVRSDNPMLVEQLDYLVSLMRKVIDQSAATGKRKPSYEEACSIVLNTYLFLGELVRLTGFTIVTETKQY